MEDPTLPLAGLGLLALLLGYGGYRVVQQRRNNGAMDSTFPDSLMNPDSLNGLSGGQQVDTSNNDTTTGASSLTGLRGKLVARHEVQRLTAFNETSACLPHRSSPKNMAS